MKALKSVLLVGLCSLLGFTMPVQAVETTPSASENYTLDVSVEGNGQADVYKDKKVVGTASQSSALEQSFAADSKLTISAAGNSGAQIKSVKINGKQSDEYSGNRTADIPVTMDADKTVVISFASANKKIAAKTASTSTNTTGTSLTVENGGNGNVWVVPDGETAGTAVSDSQSISDPSDTRVDIQADEGYAISSFILDGKSYELPSSYLSMAQLTFSGDGEHILEVEFTKQTGANDTILPFSVDLSTGTFTPNYAAGLEPISFTSLADQKAFEPQTISTPAGTGRAQTGYTAAAEWGAMTNISIVNSANATVANFQEAPIKISGNGMDNYVYCINPMIQHVDGAKTAYNIMAGEYPPVNTLGSTMDQIQQTAKMLAWADYWYSQNASQYNLTHAQRMAIAQVLAWRICSIWGNGDWNNTNLPDSSVPHSVQQEIYTLATNFATDQWQNHQNEWNVTADVFLNGASQPLIRANAVQIPVNNMGWIQLKKQSFAPNITNNNPNYSLAGAVFKVYADTSFVNEVCTLTTGADGTSNKYEVGEGTYFVKEITASPGYGIASGRTGTVTVTKANTQDNPAMVNSNDTTSGVWNETPKTWVNFQLLKTDNSNSAVPLAGAEYKVSVYASNSMTITGQTPVRSWVLKSDSKGQILLDKNHYVSGDANFWNANGANIAATSATSGCVLPLCVLTVQEVKAPSGYKLDSTVNTYDLRSGGGNGDTTITFTKKTYTDTPVELMVYKQQAGTTTAVNIPNTVFTHTKPDGTTESLTTNDQGQILMSKLTVGQHTLQETTAAPGYVLDNGKLVFTVNQNGSIQIVSGAGANTGISTDLSASVPSATFENEEQDSFISLVKKNESGDVLEGAEFTLYSDSALTQPIDTFTTNADGLIDFGQIELSSPIYMVETKAPIGYRIPVEANGKPHVYSIQAVYQPALKFYEVTVDGTTYTPANTDKTQPVWISGDINSGYVINLNVVNVTGNQLPETGSNLTLWFVLGGMLLAVAGLVVFNRRKDVQ